MTLISLCFLLCSKKIAPATTRPKPAKPPTTPPAIAPAWLVDGFEVSVSVDVDEVELAVEELVGKVEVDVLGDIKAVVVLITLLLEGVLMTVEPDPKLLVNKTVVSMSRTMP